MYGEDFSGLGRDDNRARCFFGRAMEDGAGGNHYYGRCILRVDDTVGGLDGPHFNRIDLGGLNSKLKQDFEDTYLFTQKPLMDSLVYGLLSAPTNPLYQEGPNSSQKSGHSVLEHLCTQPLLFRCQLNSSKVFSKFILISDNADMRFV